MKPRVLFVSHILEKKAQTRTVHVPCFFKGHIVFKVPLKFQSVYKCKLLPRIECFWFVCTLVMAVYLAFNPKVNEISLLMY